MDINVSTPYNVGDKVRIFVNTFIKDAAGRPSVNHEEKVDEIKEIIVEVNDEGEISISYNLKSGHVRTFNTILGKA